jgi:hypothetical protein
MCVIGKIWYGTGRLGMTWFKKSNPQTVVKLMEEE